MNKLKFKMILYETALGIFFTKYQNLTVDNLKMSYFSEIIIKTTCIQNNSENSILNSHNKTGEP
jgi:hypothetical protein